jgi:hypothetical protein
LIFRGEVGAGNDLERESINIIL